MAKKKTKIATAATKAPISGRVSRRAASDRLPRGRIVGGLRLAGVATG